jgi:hypothetical protein
MVSSSGVPRNASRAQQGEGRAASWVTSAAQGIIRAGARKPRLDKRRATGRIEHTLLDGEFSVRPNRPKTFARSHTIPQKVPNVSIYDKGSELTRYGAPTL